MPPRPLRPKDEPGTSEDQDTASDAKSSKRKAVSSACIPCRKRKSKCDGALPACSTCTAVYRTECYYDAESDHRRKGALRRDIQSLQEQNDALDVIVASLRALPEDEAISVFHSLRSDAALETLANALRNNVRLPLSYAPQTLEADITRQISPSSLVPKIDVKRLDIPSYSSSDATTSDSSNATPVEPSAVWFKAPQEAEFVEHLLNLYFCWVHPYYQFFSHGHFIHDMSRGRTEFCSAMLINALLSIACQYSDRSTAQMDGNTPSTAGNHFFSEAKRLLDRTEMPSLTTVQALAIMSVREASQGRDSNGYQYAGRCVRMALEMGLHLSVTGNGMRPSEAEVRRITYWAVFNLETIYSVKFGRLCQLPRTAADVQKPAILDRTESQIWRPYEDANLLMSPSAEQVSRSMLFTNQLSKLCELANDMVNTFYAPRDQFTSRGLANAYAAFQNWYQNIPDALRVENTTLPHVLVLHMYYYACVLHLFRPYIKLDLRSANLYPRDTCSSCASEISGIMNTLRAMYGLRRVCPAVPGLLLSATTIHLLNLPAEPATTHLSQGIHDLQTMSTNHPFAAECIDIVLSLAGKWGIVVPDEIGSASTFRSGAQRQWQSPSASSFWAATIPRQDSGGRRSNDSTSSHKDSPFAPPVSQGHQPSFAPLYNTALAQFDPHSAFWTPFPGQTMPMPAQHVVPSMDLQSMGSSSSQWQGFGPGIGSTSNMPDNRPHQDQGTMDENMAFQDWQWQ